MFINESCGNDDVGSENACLLNLLSAWERIVYICVNIYAWRYVCIGLESDGGAAVGAHWEINYRKIIGMYQNSSDKFR